MIEADVDTIDAVKVVAGTTPYPWPWDGVIVPSKVPADSRKSRTAAAAGYSSA